MAKKIQSQDLFAQDLFVKETKNAEELLVVLQKLEEEYKDILKVNSEIVKQSESKSVEGLRKRETAVKNVTEAEKMLIKIEKETQKVQTKLNMSHNARNENLILERERLKQVTAQQRKSAKETLNQGNAYKVLSSRVNEAQAKFKRLSAEFGINSKQARKARKELDKVQKEFLQINAAAKDGRPTVGRYGTALSGMGKNLKGLAFRFVAFTSLVYGLARAIGSSFRTFKNFQQENAKLASVLGKNRKEIKALTKDAKRLGSTTVFTAAQVTKLQVAFSKLGFTEEQILKTTEATLQLAAATGTDLEESATVAASVINSFGLEAEDTQRIVDVMAKSFSSSALDMSKFSTAMATVGPVEKTAGLSIERTTALLGTLVDAGIDASTAGTGLRNIFLDLSKHGLTFEQAMKKISNSADKNATALDLFGKRGATVATVLADNTEKADELSEAFQNAGGSAKAMADEQLNTLQGSITKLSSAWEGFILSLEDGDGVISQVLRGAIDMATEFLNVLTEMQMSSSQIRDQELTGKFDEGVDKANKKLTKFNETVQMSTRDLKDSHEQFGDFVLSLRDEGITDVANAQLLNLVKNVKKTSKELINAKEEEAKVVSDVNKIHQRLNLEIDESFEATEGHLAKQKHQMKTNADHINGSSKDIAESIHMINGELETYENQIEILIQNKSIDELISIIGDASIANTKYGGTLIEIAQEELQRRKDLGETVDITNDLSSSTSNLTDELNNQNDAAIEVSTTFGLLEEQYKAVQDAQKEYDKALKISGGLENEFTKQLKKELEEREKTLKISQQALNDAQPLNQIDERVEDIPGVDPDFVSDDAEEITEIESNMWAERLNAATQFYTTLAELSNARIDKELENIDKEIDASIRRQEQLESIANQDALTSEQSIAAEIKRRNELERQKAQLERRKLRRETIAKGLELLSANLNSGQSGGDATANAIRQLTGFIALLSNLPGFHTGTDNAPEGLAWTDEKGAEIHLDKNGNIKDWGSHGGARIKHLDKGDKILTANESKIVKSQMGIQPHIEAREIRIQQRAMSGNKFIVDGLKNVVKAVDDKPVQSFQYDEIKKAVVDVMSSKNEVMRKHNSNKPKFS